MSSIFLYGSHTRGTATPESDIDIAVVVNEIRDDYLDTLAELWWISRKISLDIGPVLLVAGDNNSGILDIVRQIGIAV